MKILSVEQIRQLERRTIAQFGIPSLSLMEKAGEGVAGVVVETLKKRDRQNSDPVVGIFTGKGNNGGDGFAAAYFLAREGIKSIVSALYPSKDLSQDALHFFRKAKTCKEIKILDASTVASLEKYAGRIQGCPVLIDAILGTGFAGQPKGIVAEAIDRINQLSQAATMIAVDIPSGLDATTGKAGKAVTADCTVTMGFCKSGFLLENAMNHVGSLRVVDIGIPRELSDALPVTQHLLDSEMIAPLLPRRARISHKGNYGHLLIVAGSLGMSGAAILCARAALRSGSGLVTVACPASVQHIVAQGCAEAMTLGLPETSDQTIAASAMDVLSEALKNGKYHAMALGPGLGRHKETQEFVIQALLRLDIPTVLDADGLYAVAHTPFDLRKVKCKKLVITPHLGEFASLLGRSNEAADKEGRYSDLWGNILIFAQQSGAIVVLKQHITCINDGKSGDFISFDGNPGMATAGMGDALSGMIGSFLGQDLSPLDAAKAAVFIHGRAGDAASTHKGTYGLITSDVIEAIPQAIMDLLMRRRINS